jgi:Protein of unknown function (DUF4238)
VKEDLSSGRRGSWVGLRSDRADLRRRLTAMAGHAHQHITPKGYLAAWAMDGRVSCHFVDSGETKSVSVRDAAVRKHFYSVKRPDGTHDVEFERRLGEFEGKAVPLLRTIETSWPLRGQERAIVAEYIALQVVRGPVWRARAHEIGRVTLEEHKARRPHFTVDMWSQVQEANLGQQGILDSMTGQLDKVGTLVGSMHWMLFTFKKPRLVTSDHPVSMIDINAFRTKVDAAVLPATGLLSAIEIRFPVSPTQALVLSWLDGPDTIRSRQWTGLQENFNYATCGQAEKQWFSRPGEVVRHPDTIYPLLTQSANPGYSLESVRTSPRRQETLKIINLKIEENHSPGELVIIESMPG